MSFTHLIHSLPQSSSFKASKGRASKRKTLVTMASTSFSSYSATKPTSFITLIVLLLLLSTFFCISSSSSISISSTEPPPAATTPTPWPPQFHSKQIMNITGSLSIIDLWYDWPKGRNLNIIQSQLGGQPLHDLEWNNGTSFFYTLDDDDNNKKQHCRTAQLEVGILRPNWLEGAEYLGQEKVDGFVCNVWKKVDFITYYEDVVTKRPVQWIFYTGRAVHVMTFEVGAVLEDEKCQAPVYCFHNEEEEEEEEEEARISQV